ncbi:MAG: iron-containing alcohol dehydrogenase [Thalassobaculales bacterium]
MTVIGYLTTVEFEAGVLARLPAVLAELGIARPLLVSDPGLAASGLAGRVLGLCPAQAQRFTDTPQNPTEAAVLAALDIYRAGGCDGLVAVGGGSAIDLAKGVAILAGHPGPLAQYAMIEGGVARITAAVAPLVAIPTTAGTGSEVGRGALITLSDGRKLGFISPHLIPRRALCDPDLTLSLPRHLTAATGMDALAHCIETFLSPKVNPPAEAIALDGAGRVARNLERAVADGGDRTARWEMMMAALEGGLTFQKGLGAVHALSHALGALKDPVLHHGTLNAVLLPPVLRFNAGHVGDKYARLAAAMGLPPDTDLAAWIAGLNARLGIPPSLAAMGVTAAMLPGVIAGALADHSNATNPRAASAEDYAAILASVM